MGRPASEVASHGTGTLIVMAKSPVAGQVKTRLTTGFTPGQAAALAQASLRDTLDTVVAAPASRRVVAWQGVRRSWVPASVEVKAQSGVGLDGRISDAFREALCGPVAGPTDRGGPALLVGMDTPQLRPQDLVLDWGAADAVLGLCPDGGYWAIGLSRFHPDAVKGVPMSTPRTGQLQLERLQSLGYHVRLLPMMRDVDTPADAAIVARVAPDTRFARLHRRLTRVACSPMALYDEALNGAEVVVHEAGGANAVPLRRLAVGDWQHIAPADDVLLSRCEGPVLDIGCGPGRLVESLAAQGTPALGIDISARAVTQTAARGGSVLLRAVEHRLPGEGRWGTVLLADGNIGIGGEPELLLSRCHDLLVAGGLALIEADPDDDADRRFLLTLHCADGRSSTPMPWARVGSRPLARIAGCLGFVAVEEWRVDGRVFIALRKIL